jgi:hypothetical protein
MAAAVATGQMRQGSADIARHVIQRILNTRVLVE